MDFQIFFFLSFFLTLLTKEFGSVILFILLDLAAQLFLSLGPFSEISRKAKKKEKREGMCQDAAVFSAAGQMIVVLARSPRGLHVMIQLGVGEQQTAWCSIVRLPKEMLRTYRESLCNFRSFSGQNHQRRFNRALLLSLPLLMMLLLPHAFADTEKQGVLHSDEPRRKGLDGVYIKRDLTGNPVLWPPRL